MKRSDRIRWWREARYGLFLHWGLYSLLGRNEWVLNREKIPAAEYEALADRWKPKKGFAREWARTARRAGMKYLVLTARHCEGFALWDSKVTGYNAARRGPGRDLVAEYVEACRSEGLRVGLYFCLMDWHHPDGEICEFDPAARKRYVQYLYGCLEELMSNYGRIDILWYDASWPLMSAELNESARMNRMVRRLQPGILTNGRSYEDGDFTTCEAVLGTQQDKPWESCMQITQPPSNGWGYTAGLPRENWVGPRGVLEMLRHVTLAGGNLLLNVGPKPDGTLPAPAVQSLLTAGRWLRQNGEAVYGLRDHDTREQLLDWTGAGRWTRNGKTAYYWVDRWPGSTIAVAGFKARLLRARFLATGQPIAFTQDGERILLRGLPRRCPDPIAKIAVIQLEFDSTPHQWLGMGRAEVDMPPAPKPQS